MTRPTEDEIRAEPAGRRLDAWVHMHVMGRNATWIAEKESVIEKNDKSPFGFTCNFGGAVFTSDREWLVNDWYDPAADREVPHYSTDPAACAELKLDLWESRECTCQFLHCPQRVIVSVAHRGNAIDVCDTSECVAWCRAALIAALNR